MPDGSTGRSGVARGRATKLVGVLVTLGCNRAGAGELARRHPPVGSRPRPGTSAVSRYGVWAQARVISLRDEPAAAAPGACPGG